MTTDTLILGGGGGGWCSMHTRYINSFSHDLPQHACVSSRGAQSTELVWILDFKQILLLLLLYDVNDDRIHMAKIRYMESKNKALRG